MVILIISINYYMEGEHYLCIAFLESYMSLPIRDTYSWELRAGRFVWAS